jgi:uncharacterized membrane protein/predicted DsbA family dithiol-disulfide isomerase
MRLLPVLMLRLALLVAMSASAALVVDYANAGDPAFCGVTSGCFAVRTSGFAYLFGYIPLPQVGLATFASLFGIAFVARSRLQHTVVATIAGLGGLFALYLLYLQKFVIGAMCPWCVAVDTAAIVAANSSIWVLINARKDEASVRLPAAPRVTWSWVVAAIIGLVAPFVWGQFPAEPPLPAAIQKEQVPDKLIIVAFTDFECPFCRRMHPVLHRVVEAQGERVHFVRKMMPLSGHPGAEPAALVYLCSPENLREAVADKLYTATADKLTPEGSIVLGASAGVDADALSVCVKSPETRAKLEADKKLFEELGGRGLPFTFVGKRVVLGFNPDRVEAAVASELAGKHASLPVWAMFVLIAAAFIGAIGVTVGATRADKLA